MIMLDPAFNLSYMTSSYTIPRMESACQFLHQLHFAEKQGFLSFSFLDVVPQERIPWRFDEHIIDSYIEFSTLGAREFFSQSEDKKVVGSGLNKDHVLGSVHAASEAWERLAARLEGQSHLRPSASLAWSTKHEIWVNITEEYEDFQDLKGHRSGEAFHIIPAEATRAALCELVEKDIVYKMFEGNHDFDIGDITTFASQKYKRVQYGIQGFQKLGFEVTLFHTVVWGGIHVVLACSRSHHPLFFPNSFKGSAADFSLEYALYQALSELERACFMGKPSALKSAKEAVLSVQRGELSSASADIALLMLPSSRSLWNPLFLVAQKKEVEDIPQNSNEVIEIIKSHTEDIFIIPLIKNLFGVDGIATKILIPHYSQFFKIADKISLCDISSYV